MSYDEKSNDPREPVSTSQSVLEAAAKATQVGLFLLSFLYLAPGLS